MGWLSWTTSPESWIALGTLTALELVLGIDNIVFISILCGRVGEARRALARRLGLLLAMGMRVGLLFTLSWVIHLEEPFFSLFGKGLSGRDLILVAGGLFLIYKSTREIHHRFEEAEAPAAAPVPAALGVVLVQIALFDIIFSIDSVITAVGMVEELPVMVIAVVISVLLMLLFSGPVSDFVERHPTVKMLALSFLLLIGMALVADGWGLHIPKGYIYTAMGFSVFVEMLNLKLRGKSETSRAAEALRNSMEQ